MNLEDRYDEAEDRAIGQYIEKKRKEYEDEWSRYLSEDVPDDEIDFLIGMILR